MKKTNRWVYAVTGVVVLLFAGLVYAWSVMKPFIKAYGNGWTDAQMSLAFTLVMAFFCIGCLIAGFLSTKVKPRIYVIISGLLFCAGFFIATVTTPDSLVMLYLGFSVLCGLGAGFAYNAVMSCISAWFPDKQGLISGILLMGFGLSAFIIGKVFQAITADGDGWKTTFHLFGIIIPILFFACSFLFVRPGADFVPPAGSGKKTVREPASDVNTSVMIKNPSFWLYYAWAIFTSAAGLVLVGQARSIAEQVSAGTIAAGTIVTVVGLISIMNGIGRVCFGMLFDKAGYRITMIADMIVFVVASLILMIALKSGSFTLLTAGFLVGGFAYGGVTPTNSAIISDFFGRTHYSLNFSLINTNLLIASFATSISGKLYDATQSYMSSIIMMLVVTGAAFIVFLGIRRPDSK